jgi:protein-S-isoprenylcysteine O-methyltransferase Ste14
MIRIKALLIGLMMPVLVGAVIFLAAGRWDLPFVWGVITALTGYLVTMVVTGDEGMIRERVSPGGEDRDRWSRTLGGVLLVGSWIVMGLDVGRFHWSLVPRSLQAIGLIGYVVSLALLFWTMRNNPFYSSVVRVQTDRGQRPVTTGPYRFVRHPGYAASILAMLTGSLALGSWLAMLVMLSFIAVFIRRTLLEDRLLQRELPGYADYAQRVRYRLIPGLF